MEIDSRATLETLGVTPDLIRAYDQRIPRYTSYPTAPYWTKEVGPAEWRRHVTTEPGGAPAALALYVHVPFCAKRCSFCGCNVIIARRREAVDDYVSMVRREAALLRQRYQGNCRVVQLHLGGGTPNFLEPDEMRRLVKMLEESFPFAEDAERSIEMDPRIARPGQLALLARLGFNRVSFGAQDFSPEVQEAIGRTQTLDCTLSNVEAARRLGFRSVNIDLIYGLPRQTPATWSETLNQVLRLRPDRLAVYNFAYLPQAMPNQRTINPEELPAPEAKMQMFVAAHDRLCGEGYDFIGMDHYALADDSLAVAQRQGTLHRNFMGYTTMRGTDLIAFGVSAISDLRGGFAQNVKKLSQYRAMLAEGLLPVERGLFLSEDDWLRRYVIEEVMCNGVLRYDGPFGAQIHQLIRDEHERLRLLEDDGLIDRQAASLRVTSRGRLFLRNIAHVFDAYAKAPTSSPLFSRSI